MYISLNAFQVLGDLQAYGLVLRGLGVYDLALRGLGAYGLALKDLQAYGLAPRGQWAHFLALQVLQFVALDAPQCPSFFESALQVPLLQVPLS